jgi:DNA replication and repair protein RecF
VIERVVLRNIRSWSAGEVTLSTGPQLLWGSNGAGKTTIIEACLVAATGRSHRAGALRELLADGAQAGSLSLTVADNDASTGDPLARSTLSVEVLRDDRSRHLVDGTSRRSSALSARLRVATFVPEETALVTGGPALRRSTLDRIATQWRAGYRDAATRYERALRQRNHLLKAAQAEGASARSLSAEIAPWTELLVDAGAEIVEGRLALLAAIATPLAAAHEEVAPDEPSLSVAYRSREGYAQDATRGEIIAQLSAALRDTATAETHQGHTLVGPHRDDAIFSVGGREMADVASRGQQRSVLLALLFAEIEMLVDDKGRPPVLLLDDAFSELDPKRRDHLVRRIADTPQTIITTTTLADLPPALTTGATVTEIVRGPNGSEARGEVKRG